MAVGRSTTERMKRFRVQEKNAKIKFMICLTRDTVAQNENTF